MMDQQEQTWFAWLATAVTTAFAALLGIIYRLHDRRIKDLETVAYEEIPDWRAQLQRELADRYVTKDTFTRFEHSLQDDIGELRKERRADNQEINRKLDRLSDQIDALKP